MSVFRKILIFRAKNGLNGAVKYLLLSIHVRICPIYVRTKNRRTGKVVPCMVFLLWGGRL